MFSKKILQEDAEKILRLAKQIIRKYELEIKNELCQKYKQKTKVTCKKRLPVRKMSNFPSVQSIN